MHVSVDLGFSSLLFFLACLVLPVIGFSIRRKWRRSLARKVEIRRLLILAAEEAARAELEATASYGAVPVVIRDNYQCAVCYCPTTTRCARCKAVRYCSGKCQIIHWRQGHRDECRPPTIAYSVNDDCSGSSQKVEKEELHDIYHQKYTPIESSDTEPVLSNPLEAPGVPIVKDDDVRADFVSDTEGANSVSELSGTSFSGFSTPPVGRESLDDVSVTESASSDEPDGSEGQISTDIPSNTLNSSFHKGDGTKPLSPKFASLVDSVDIVDRLSKLDQSKPFKNNGKSQCESYSSSGHNFSVTGENSTTKPGKISSVFWGRTLESFVSSDDVRDDSAPSSSSGSPSSKLSDSEPLQHVKFSLPGGSASSLHGKSLEVKEVMKDNPLPSTLGFGKSVDRVSSSEKAGTGASKVKGSQSMSAGGSDLNGSSGDSNVSKLSEPKPTSSSAYANKPSGMVRDVVGSNIAKVSRSPSIRSESTNLVVNNPASTSNVSKPRSMPSASQARLASNANGKSNSSAKIGKVEHIQAGAATSPQTNFPPSSINGLKISMRKVVDQFRGPKSGRYSDKGIFPYDLFVQLYTSNKLEMRPCGLINCGNSCYANAVLQCLAFTPPLTAYFVQGLHSKACLNKGWCFTCEFESLILKAKDGKSVLSPAGVLSQLQNMGSHLGNGKEEDAHEFLRYAIDAMQSVCLKEAGVNVLGSVEEETTLIGYTFGGYLRSKIKCMKCQYKSERQERMMDLTVEIEGDIGKLEDALKRFTGTEILDGDNKYQCSRCKSYEKAKKKLTILEAPNVLTIALKRFQSGKFGKLNKSIRFPEILDLAPYMSDTSDKSPIYRLYGVVVHLDVMNASFSGHYVCYVKSIQNKWFKIDDSTVTAVELEKVLTKGAYMLLYARCSPRAPRLIRNRMTSPDSKSKGSPSRINIKNGTSNTRSISTDSRFVQFPDSGVPNSVPADNLACVESFYLKFHRLQKILEEDSSSDNYSFTSSNSDEGSCSTDSNRDSTSTDDLSDYIFGSWNSSWRNASDSDASSSSSSSPLYSRHSPLAEVDQNASCSPEAGRSRVYPADSGADYPHHWDRIPSGNSRLVDMDGRGVDPFLHSDKNIPRRKLESSSSCRENDSVKLGRGNPFNVVKSGVSFRRSVSERTD